MECLTQQQQQFSALQAHIQAQASPAAGQPVPATLLMITTSLKALAAHSLEQQQMCQSFAENVSFIMNRLSQRGHGRPPIPLALSPKLKGDDDFTQRIQV